MANSKVVGKLLIDIEARTAKMETDLAAATNKLDKFNNSTRAAIKGMTGFDIGNIGKSFLKFTLLLDGVRSILNSLANSVKEVWANATMLGQLNIISPQAAAEISFAQEALHSISNAAKGFLGGLMGYIATAVIAWKNLIIETLRKIPGWDKKFKEDVLPDAFGDTPDKLEAIDIGEAAQRQKNLALMAQKGAATREAARAEMDPVMKVLDMRKEMYQLELETQKVGLYTSNEILVKEIRIEQLRQSSDAMARQTLKQELELTRAIALAEDKGSRVQISDAKRLKQVAAEIATLKKSLEGKSFRVDPMAPDKIQSEGMSEADLGRMRSILALTNEQNSLLSKQKEMYTELGATIAQTAVDSILALDSLTDVLKNVAKAIAQVIIQRMIIAPLADMVTGGLMAGGSAVAGKKAAGGPVLAGRTYLVGEQGMELFTPNTSGNITTNGDTRAAAAGGGGSVVYSPVYNIAAGVTASDLRVVLDNHEKRVRGGIMSDIARGGGRAARFGA